jgi:hypothetical protein
MDICGALERTRMPNGHLHCIRVSNGRLRCTRMSKSNARGRVEWRPIWSDIHRRPIRATTRANLHGPSAKVWNARGQVPPPAPAPGAQLPRRRSAPAQALSSGPMPRLPSRAQRRRWARRSGRLAGTVLRSSLGRSTSLAHTSLLASNSSFPSARSLKVTKSPRWFAGLVLLGTTFGFAGACGSSSSSSHPGDDSGGGSSAGQATGGDSGSSGSANGGAGAATGGGATTGGIAAGGSAMGGSGGANGGSATGGSGAGGSANGGGSSGAGGSDPSACGVSTCAASQVCIRPCCGGTAPLCTPRPASGVCPAGTDPVPFCLGSSGAGCQEKPCTPTAPFCADVPSGCGSNINCSCLGRVCDVGACGVIDGRNVHCLCA